MLKNKIKLQVIEFFLDKESSRLLSTTNIRRLGGRKNDGKAEQIFKCIQENRQLYVESEELKKLLCFISYKESFPEKDLLEISRNFNRSLKDSSIDIFMNIYVKEKNKTNNQLLNILITVNERSDDLDEILKKYIEVLHFERKNNKEISEIEEIKSNKIEEMHNAFFLNYDQKVFKYVKESNLNNNVYSIIENIQKNKFSKNKDLNSKLLKSYKGLFIQLEDFLLNQSFSASKIKAESKTVLTDFLYDINKILIEQFKKIKEIKKKLDYKKIIEEIKPIENKLMKYIDHDRLQRENKTNPFSGIQNKKEDAFYCLDELIAFFSSENGRNLDEIFKRNQVILKLFNLLISIDLLQEGKHVFLSEFKVDEIYSFEEEFKSFKLENIIFYPGYNLYFNEHLVNDIYSVLGNKDLLEQERLISYLKKIIPCIEVGLDSNLSKIYENAVYSGNSNAVKVLNGYLNNFKPNDLRILTEGEYSNETILNSIDLLKDINLKGYYKYIYNGNYNTLKTLYEDNINTLSEDSYTLEMNFCLKGKKSVETSRVMFDESTGHHTNPQQFKLRFLNVAALYKNKEVLEDNLEFLKEQNSNSDDIIELLAHCLNNNMIDIFQKIYASGKFDMNKIFMRFYRFSPNITKDPKIWEVIINDLFKELDINKEMKIQINLSLLGLDDKKYPDLNLLESPIKDESSIALYVAHNFFPKGIKNFNHYSFGIYNLTFLDKLRKESKYYKSEFEAMYKIVTSKITLEKNNAPFDIVCTGKKGEFFKVTCKINKKDEPEVILLKTNSHENKVGGLNISDSNYNAYENVIDLNSQNNNAILSEAIKSKDIKKIKELLKKKINVNDANINGINPLTIACIIGEIEVVELLLKNGADPNKKTFALNLDFDNSLDIMFPLLSAIQYNHLNIVKLLIKYDVDVNTKQVDGYTSLMLASERGSEEIVKILIKNNADVNAKRNDGSSALGLASECGHLKVIENLIKDETNLNIQNNIGFTPLMSAAQFGYKNIVKLLLQKGANSNILSNFPQCSTALSLASISGVKESVESLLEFDANINHKGINGFTALHLAAEGGHKYIAELLIKKGGYVDIQNEDGATPLMQAIQFGHINVVRLLQKKGANINLKLESGWTPLMLANSCNGNDIEKFLQKKESELINQYGKQTKIQRKKSPYDYQGIIKFLISKGAKY